MFQSLSERLSEVFDRLTRRGTLSTSDIDSAMREVRRALLEADVALEVVRSFVEKIKREAVGREVLRSVTPGQMVVKIVHDALVAVLGSTSQKISLDAPAPVGILVVGLQGSGKTTTTSKIGYRLTNAQKKRVLMASLDTHRPAAQEQLRILGEQTQVATLPIVSGETPQQIALRAMNSAHLGGYDVVLLDTAGRNTIDDEMMAEVVQVRDATKPHEVLLVADSLTGQDAVNTASAFDRIVGLTGIVLTRADGDARGGAALSMRAVTGRPIKLLGVGEKWHELEDFSPERIAGRILGMGDIVSLVEKASQVVDEEKARNTARRFQKGIFDFEDLADQLKQMQRLGGMGSVLGLMPGMGKVKKQLAQAHASDKLLKRQCAIIGSMTLRERHSPRLLDARRKRRIAAGAGARVQDVNQLIKLHRMMADMMKSMGKTGGLMSSLFGKVPEGRAGVAGLLKQAGDHATDPRAASSLPFDSRGDAEVSENDLTKLEESSSSLIPSLSDLSGLGARSRRGVLPSLGGGSKKRGLMCSGEKKRRKGGRRKRK